MKIRGIVSAQRDLKHREIFFFFFFWGGGGGGGGGSGQ